MESDLLIPVIVSSFCLFLSGVLGAIQKSFLFFRNYQERIEDTQLAETAIRSIEYWKKEGYTEACSFGRVLLDSISLIILSDLASSVLFPHLGSNHFVSLPFGALWAAAVTFFISHFLIPTLGQVFLSQLAGSMLSVFSFFWIWFGWLGKLIYLFNHFILKKSGFIKKFKLVSENDLNRLDKGEAGFRETGLEHEEAKMVQNIFNIGTILVKEIFTPRVDTEALEVSTPYPDVIKLIQQTRYTRIPVYEETIDKIIGILHVKDLLALDDSEKNGGFSLRNVVRPAYFIPRSKKIDELMTEFRKEHSHMAIVVDEYGGTAGIITMEDILEEIVGEIQDEDDVEPPLILENDNGSYEIDPVIALDDLNRELDLNLRPGGDVDIDTLGGLLQYIKGSVPQEGDTIESNGCSFKVLQMEGQSIEKVQLSMKEGE